MEKEHYDLKKGVDFTGITCVFFCTDGKGNLLLQKRSAHCRDEHGKWDNGGGSMEFYEESFESVIRREVKEEYCVEVAKIEFAGVKNVRREHNGIKTHWIALIFAALVIDPENIAVGEPQKADEVKWFPLNDLPNNLHSQILSQLEMVRPVLERI